MAKPTKAQEEAREQQRVEQARINRLFYDSLGSEGATEIIEVLERKFELRSMIKKGSNGMVDPYLTIANNGAYEVMSYIKQRIDSGSRNE